MNFLRTSVFDIHTDDWKTSFQSVKKRVHHDLYKLFWDNFPPSFRKNFIFQNRKISPPFSLHLFCNLKPAIYNWLDARFWFFFIPKKFQIDLWSIHKNVLFPLTLHIFFLLVFQTQLLNRIFSKVIDNPLNDKALVYKTLWLCNTIGIPNFSFWLVNQLLLFRKNNIATMQTKILNLFPRLKLPLLQKFMKTILKPKMLMLNQLNCKKCSTSSNKLKIFLNHTELIIPT